MTGRGRLASKPLGIRRCAVMPDRHGSVRQRCGVGSARRSVGGAPLQAVASAMRVFRRFAVAFRCVRALRPTSASLVAGIAACWQRRWLIEFFSIKFPAQMQHPRPSLPNGSILAVLRDGEPELLQLFQSPNGAVE